MKKLRAESFSLDVWKEELLVCHGPFEAFVAYAKPLGIDMEHDEEPAGRTAMLPKSGHIMVWVRDIEDIPVLVHELFHAVLWVLTKRGLVVDSSSEEAYAYSMELLLGKILNHKRWRTTETFEST